MNKYNSPSLVEMFRALTCKDPDVETFCFNLYYYSTHKFPKVNGFNNVFLEITSRNGHLIHLGKKKTFEGVWSIVAHLQRFSLVKASDENSTTLHQHEKHEPRTNEEKCTSLWAS